MTILLVDRYLLIRPGTTRRQSAQGYREPSAKSAETGIRRKQSQRLTAIWLFTLTARRFHSLARAVGRPLRATSDIDAVMRSGFAVAQNRDEILARCRVQPDEAWTSLGIPGVPGSGQLPISPLARTDLREQGRPRLSQRIGEVRDQPVLTMIAIRQRYLAEPAMDDPGGLSVWCA